MRLSTTDLYEGAYLLSRGIKLEKIWQDNERRKRAVVFEFEGECLCELREKYIQGRARANIFKFKNSITELKDVMFNLLREKELRGESNGFREKKVYRSAVRGHQK